VVSYQLSVKAKKTAEHEFEKVISCQLSVISKNKKKKKFTAKERRERKEKNK